MEIRKGTTEDAAYTQSILFLNNNRITSVLREPNVSNIGGTFIANPASTYKHSTITKIRIKLADGDAIDFEVQDVSNQPTWNLGTQASLDQAIQDLNDFLRT